MSYLIALGMNLTGLRFTGLPSDVIGVLAQANTGMALIVLGLTLDFSFDSSHWKLIAKVLGLRYIAGLTVGIVLYFLLPFPLVYRTVILFGLTLPVMMAVIPYSVEFSYDTRVAGTIANFTMIISFALMWIFMIFMGGLH
jgi:predicted permease